MSRPKYKVGDVVLIPRGQLLTNKKATTRVTLSFVARKYAHGTSRSGIDYSFNLSDIVKKVEHKTFCQTISKPNAKSICVIVHDPMSGRSGRYTTHKIQLSGHKTTTVIGRELPLGQSRKLALKALEKA